LVLLGYKRSLVAADMKAMPHDETSLYLQNLFEK
jgi:hypothetical protein